MDTGHEQRQLESVSTLGLMIVLSLLLPGAIIGALQAASLHEHWLGQAIQYAVMPAAFVTVALIRRSMWWGRMPKHAHRRSPMSASRIVVLGVLFGCLIVVSNSVFAGLSWKAVGVAVGTEAARHMMEDEQNRLLQLLVAEKSVMWRVYFCAIVIVMTPIAEELFFRGYLYNVLRHRWGVPAAAVVSAAIFSMFHFYVIQALPLFVAGILLTLLYEHTGSLRGPMIAHGVTNALVLLLFWATAG